jgi:tripartite-type tricarboxylate transporter receptor subunit TctC
MNFKDLGRGVGMLIHSMRESTRNSLRIVAALLLALPLTQVHAQAWPARQVTLVVPFTAGTGADALARAVGPKLTQSWGQPVVVDNKAGASGGIGAEAVAKAAPNGYTLLLTVGSFTITPALLKDVPYDVVRDFTPIAKLGVAGFALTVNPAALPVSDFAAFLSTVRKSPGKYNYSSPGNGTPHHLGMELLKLRLGLNIQHVPYKGFAGALTDLLGGQVQALYTLVPSVIDHARTGKLRVLAVSGAKRTPLMPDAPTFREQGQEFMDQVEGWYGLLAPAKTPPDIVSRVNAEFRGVLNQPDIRAFLLKQGVLTEVGTPEEFGAFLRTDLVRWAELVKAAKLTID